MKIYCAVHSEAFPTIKQSEPVEISIRGHQRVESISPRQGYSIKPYVWIIRFSKVIYRDKDVIIRTLQGLD